MFSWSELVRELGSSEPPERPLSWWARFWPGFFGAYLGAFSLASFFTWKVMMDSPTWLPALTLSTQILAGLFFSPAVPAVPVACLLVPNRRLGHVRRFLTGMTLTVVVVYMIKTALTPG